MSLALIFLAVLVGPILYLLVTLTGTQAASYADYHYAGRTIPFNQFADSTVGYALQVAAITLFATWGFQFGFWAIWVPIFWGAGYFLLARLLDQGNLDGFLLQENVGTIHQFLSDKAGCKLLGALAALASLIGVAGPAMFEASYVGSLVAKVSAGSLPPDSAVQIINDYTPLFSAGFLIVAAIYMLYGGFRAIVNTDVYQLYQQ